MSYYALHDDKEHARPGAFKHLARTGLLVVTDVRAHGETPTASSRASLTRFASRSTTGCGTSPRYPGALTLRYPGWSVDLLRRRMRHPRCARTSQIARCLRYEQAVRGARKTFELKRFYLQARAVSAAV